MILDGCNMEQGAKRGVEKVTREIRTKLIIRRSVDFIIALIIFSLSTYFRKTLQVEYQLYCVMATVTVNGFIVNGYNAYILHTKGNILINIVSQTVLNGQKQISLKQKKKTHDDTQLEKNLKRMKLIIPGLVIILIGEGLGIFSFVIWAGITSSMAEGMAYSSIVMVFFIVFVLIPSYLMVNRLLIVWL